MRLSSEAFAPGTPDGSPQHGSPKLHLFHWQILTCIVKTIYAVYSISASLSHWCIKLCEARRDFFKSSGRGGFASFRSMPRGQRSGNCLVNFWEILDCSLQGAQNCFAESCVILIGSLNSSDASTYG